MLRRLRRNTTGATIVEFAIVAPVMVLFMMGAGDLALQAYVTGLLNGEVAKAGRDSSLQNNAGATANSNIDARVVSAVRTVIPSITYVSSRQNYTGFANVARPEPLTDTNANGVRDVGECYSDVNGNNQWDADMGRSGQGGASAVALYTITIRYPHLFPVSRLFGDGQDTRITARTLLLNQPYAAAANATPASICTP